jgi:hypothetical protein
MALHQCPNQLSADLLKPLELLARAWATSPIRPHLLPQVVEAWDRVISEWADDDSLPLLVRKANGNRGHAMSHESGRIVVPVDNTSAQWVFRCAADDIVWSLDDVRNRFGEIPVAQALNTRNGEKSGATYFSCNSKKKGTSAMGWRLAHIDPVGLHSQWQDCSLEELKVHFSLLMSPSNMFVVPMSLAGLAEVPEVIHSVKSYLRES